MTALLWFRRDLRLHDHPALRAALQADEQVVPVFCFDPRLLHGRHASGPRTQFLLECLADLKGSLRARGATLMLRTSPAEQSIPKLARELQASSVFWTEDVGPFARRRDRRVRNELEHAGVEARELPGLFAVERPDGLHAGSGEPYKVFTAFHRAWLKCPRREVLPAPRLLPAPPAGAPAGELPTLEGLGLEQTAASPARGGEHAGRSAMLRFVSDGVSGYEQGREDIGSERSSRLSPYLHFGCISARELEEQLGGGNGAEAFRRQLAWRDFYAHVLAHNPDNARREFQPRYRGTLRWSRATTRFDAWREGRTGYPLVDAGMRQLKEEGWMHNRARLIVGSFLTKDLAIDWRWGERWFMRQLIDGDEANNNGNWQWIASVGVDPQPPFRRMYNPTRKQQRFDPNGSYVRRYVLELREVPDEHLAEPWTMPEKLQRRVGCIIGKDYPERIVDHGAARRDALARYARAGRPAATSARPA